jgi:microcystin-dependent protein
MSDQYLSEIRMYAGSTPPDGWLPCDGRLVPVQNYVGLFAMIGASFGGNGSTNFALPDLRGGVPLHQGQGQGLTRRYVGETDGSPTVYLNVLEIPEHTHAVNASTSVGDQVSPAGSLWAQSSSRDKQFAPGGTPLDTQMGAAIEPAGGGQPHENMAPYLAVSYIISFTGISPLS